METSFRRALSAARLAVQHSHPDKGCDPRAVRRVIVRWAAAKAIARYHGGHVFSFHFRGWEDEE